jgi:hypothetical protein
MQRVRNCQARLATAWVEHNSIRSPFIIAVIDARSGRTAALDLALMGGFNALPSELKFFESVLA